ncbi:MAG TPA: SDR family oxidoreductase [Steroidobacteraceae bacterium]|nr:SDR family oxidoreductase [Steroidobacteraceae bacterium]
MPFSPPCGQRRRLDWSKAHEVVNDHRDPDVADALPTREDGGVLLLASGAAEESMQRKRSAMHALEVWGGVECTVNRVHDVFHDQLVANGHDTRIDDLDRFAALGLRRLRYPVLWERTAANSPNELRFEWADARMQRMRSLGVDPIVGLLHHGSGPRYTSLIDPHFPDLFANYAGAVARRYPWANAYTPINEPLTTARFSALYGHWFPHKRDDASFARAIVNQCRATVLAMQAIRAVNSHALLVQTDDLGRTRSTPELSYQARFDNERRWLGWDLLCGMVDRDHPLWRYLIDAGIRNAELKWFVDNPCPPDIIGINHYVTSDRYLHEDVHAFPRDTWGGNGRHDYADAEAVRVIDEAEIGISQVLWDCWQRYRRTIAITEVHLGCHRDEQLRWLYEVWNAANEVRSQGIDLRAVTVWALLGSFDWDSLLTRVRGHYEPGAFDLRGNGPRPTALAHLTQDLANNRPLRNRQILSEKPWWRRPTRLFQSLQQTPVREAHAIRTAAPEHDGHRAQSPLLVAGAKGLLGRAFARICDVRGLYTHACGRNELDICEPDQIDRLLDDVRPWAVVNTAGYVRIGDAERESDDCYRLNVRGAELLASACQRRGIRFLTFSSDLVFDGERSSPYLETHNVRPLNVYGRSKADAERAVTAANPNALVIRTSACFGPWDEFNFVTSALRTLQDGKPYRAMHDVVVSPTYLPDLVHAALDLLIDGAQGLWHLTNVGRLSWAELAREAARLARVRTDLLAPESQRNFADMPALPAFSALSSERGNFMPPLEDALSRYVATRRTAA